MTPYQQLETSFRRVVVLLCGFYLAIEALYVAHLPLVMDEFQGAKAVHRLLEGIPYRDFVPYKTLLGYYLELIPLSLPRDPWNGLLLVKGFLALVNAAAIWGAAILLARHLSRPAVVLALAAWVCMSTYLERSASLRVDALTSLAGLFSLLCLLGRRPGVAGLLAGISFLVSQKGIFYAGCGGAALLAVWLGLGRDRAALRDLAVFGAAASMPVLVYVGFWSVWASPGAVIQAVFLAPYGVAVSEDYEIRSFWFQTWLRNPFFWIAALLGLAEAWSSRRRGDPRDRILLVYGGTLLALALWYRQPWPYFFVLVIPTLFVAIARFFEAELERGRGPGPGLSRPVLVAFLALGVAYPISRIPTVLRRDNEFQRRTATAADRLLADGGTYLAGFDLVHTRHQVLPELAWLDAPRLAALHAMEATALDALAARLDREPVRFVVWNYRLQNLPEPLRHWLRERFVHFDENLYLYAPRFPAGEGSVSLPVEGRYRIEAPAPLEIDGGMVQPEDVVRLAAGTHRTRSAAAFRLHLQPWVADETRNPAERRAPRPFFDAVYTY